MRRIIESTLMSLDGVVGDPRWAMEYRDASVQADALARLGDTDTLLLGRGVYETFAMTWPGQSNPFADRMNSINKLVFSSTLEKADWNNSTIVRGDSIAEVEKLKQGDGGDIALFGHGRFAQSLLENGLIDELRISVHPVLAGAGSLFFSKGEKTGLKLVDSTVLGTGVVVLCYQPA
jgi:dihydrofolate reductase